ncbi:MAG: alpha-glucosidase/alpha-galactosidase [Thermoproteus sp. AZ2]|uniref:Alpha-glucosidase/alpha-galactosidase n=1 Tax=Thermoproteus sp. AZ2 TaxID=1609232 RepID=A0ACC6V381_9CREN|nr:MAG: hypothetical protein TU35_01795 [Thermoproteus sp. AZ2]
MPKIAIIGAGSAQWLARFVKDIALISKDRNDVELYLMDISEERLELAYKLAKKYVEELKTGLKIRRTFDRGEAIRDADFVINSALAKGYRFTDALRDSAERHGYYRGLDAVEWNFVMDYIILTGYYQYKLALNIAKDIEDLAPSAWYIIVANPVLEITTLLSRSTKLKVVGVCDGPIGYKDLARRLGVFDKELEVEVVGLNHDIWLTKFEVDGSDGYELIDEFVERKAQTIWEQYWRGTCPECWGMRRDIPLQISPAAVDMYKTYGLYPIGDTPRNGTWKYHRDLETKRRWYGPFGGRDSEIGRRMYYEDIRLALLRLKEVAENPAIPATSIIPPRLDEEPRGRVPRMDVDPAVAFIDAVMNNKRSLIVLNVPNQGALLGVPDDVVVEVPVEVDSNGIHRRVYSLPPRVLKLAIWPRITRMEMALEAFIKGGRDSLRMWLEVDPRTRSEKQIEEAIDDVLNTSVEIGGDDEMKKHYS